MRKVEEPQISHNKDNLKDSTETHPAYGQILASRVSGRTNLYGSDFEHNGYVVIRIKTSELHRGLSHDWHHAKKEIIEVAVSEAQWATFVSTMNSGDGPPCTLRYVRDVGDLPAIARTKNRQEQFNKELTDRLDAAERDLKKLGELIEASSLSKRAQAHMLGTLHMIHNNLTPNLSFVAKSFGEHMERNTEHAKMEISAYITGSIQRAGLKALGVEAPLQLEGDNDAVTD